MTTKVMLLAGMLAVGAVGALRAQQPSDAASTYAKVCASCHGAKGSPSATMARSMGVPDFAGGAIATVPDSVLKGVITNGKGRMMPSYKTRFTPEQIAALVAYIRTLKQ